MINNDVLRIIEVVYQGDQFSSSKFVGTIDCLILSINPEYTILENSHYLPLSLCFFQDHNCQPHTRKKSSDKYCSKPFLPQILLEQEDEEGTYETSAQVYDPGHSDPHLTAYVAQNQANTDGFLQDLGGEKKYQTPSLIGYMDKTARASCEGCNTHRLKNSCSATILFLIIWEYKKLLQCCLSTLCLSQDTEQCREGYHFSI